MRIGMPVGYAGSRFRETVDEVVALERAGLDLVHVAEAYSFDSVSQLGYLAAKTSTVQLASGIFNIYSRTPTLLGMTAAGLDHVSDGRFVLGIGASGPQVVEGFHGVPYTAPLARTREVVDVVRQVLRREVVEHDGPQIHIPLTEEHGGSGLGKPLKLINQPVRSSIPMVLAALGPKNVALAAELFEAWEPVFFYPERAAAAFGAPLAAGSALRDSALPPLEVFADTTALITDDPAAEAAALAKVRATMALYVGGMGARGKNFYNDLAVRYGFADDAAVVQDLYLAGRKAEAAAALPEELVRGVSLVGDRARVQDRMAAFAEAGVTMVIAKPAGETLAERIETVELLKGMG
jgi:F420-dependent oxidoreductase-like protein